MLWLKVKTKSKIKICCYAGTALDSSTCSLPKLHWDFQVCLQGPVGGHWADLLAAFHKQHSNYESLALPRQPQEKVTVVELIVCGIAFMEVSTTIGVYLVCNSTVLAVSTSTVFQHVQIQTPFPFCKTKAYLPGSVTLLPLWTPGSEEMKEELLSGCVDYRWTLLVSL